MKNYTIMAKVTPYVFLTVQANSEEEALQIAEDTDGGEFDGASDGEGDLEILDVVNICEKEEEK